MLEELNIPSRQYYVSRTLIEITPVFENVAAVEDTACFLVHLFTYL